jgi:hypothetical protein
MEEEERSDLESKSEEPMLGPHCGADDVIITREYQDFQLSVIAEDLLIQRDFVSIKICQWPMIPKSIAALIPSDFWINMQSQLNFLQIKIF